MTQIQEGVLLWKPTAARLERSHLTRYLKWLAARGHTLADTVTTFYSDSINDLPLLERVTHAVCVDPDAKLAQKARERGWSILALHRDRASASA